MTRIRNLFALLAILVLVGWLAAADDKKADDKTDTAPRAKGTLPQGWKGLGLTDSQKSQIYTIQSNYRGKIEELEQKIRELRQQERAEALKVLTDAQKARLKEIGEEKFATDVPKKDDSKKDAATSDPKKDEVKKP
jgi:Spy/CpxP family protein refolding chaperone